MTRIIATKGLPGSGKTTWAKAFVEGKSDWKRVNNDDLRLMFNGVRYDKRHEKFIGKARLALINAALSDGYSVVVDNCNLSPRAVAELEALAASFNAPLSWQDFTDVDVEACIARDAQRANPVGRKVIMRMYDDFLAPPKAVYTPPAGKWSAVICDIDGTLALKSPNRGVYDFDRAGEDTLNTPVRDVLSQLAASGADTILLSGREDKYRQVTEDWLDKNGVVWDRLLMRPTGDNRRDDIVKRELFEAHIRNEHAILCVLDDRDRVVRMWRDLGLTCLQVAEGDF